MKREKGGGSGGLKWGIILKMGEGRRVKMTKGEINHERAFFADGDEITSASASSPRDDASSVFVGVVLVGVEVGVDDDDFESDLSFERRER